MLHRNKARASTKHMLHGQSSVITPEYLLSYINYINHLSLKWPMWTRDASTSAPQALGVSTC